MAKIVFGLVWFIAAACIVFIVSLPINLQTHLIAGTIVLLIMILLKLFKSEGTWRLVALAFGTAIVLRYVYWRTTSTLPPVNQLENFIPGLLLYLAEMYSVFMLFLSLFIVARPLPSRPPQPVDEGDLPSVDVFIPSYNEDPVLLADTIAAAMALDYPADRLTVWLLDDGGTDQKRNSENVIEAQVAEARRTNLQKLCAELGARYLTRARNEHAKAGNLNNGLDHSTSDLIAVFDADHAPARSFLRETVGYFNEDKRLFLVQTPHFFLNPDPLERNLKTFEKMPSENEMFYGVIQRGLDKWNAAFFCGSAAVLRREALQESNGFSGISITEDCETAIELHSRGWNSVYVDKPLIAGLQPATFASFIGQRSRWAQGMMQILRFRFPLLKRGLSFPQRLCYMSSTLFWLFPFPRTVFLFAPLFYLFLDLQIFTASGGEFLAYTLSYMAVNLMMQNYLYGSFRWPWISELYEYIQTVHLLPAVISVALNPRKPTFKVTAKDETITTSRLSELSRPFFVIFGVLVIGVFVTVWRIYAEPYKADVTFVVGAWNLLNLVMAGAALGVVAERRERAATRRVQINRRCEFGAGDIWVPATIEDVSVNGARVRVSGQGALASVDTGQASIRFTPHWSTEPEILPVIIRNKDREGDAVAIGCSFVRMQTVHHRMIADLIFANADQWTHFQASRRRNPGVLLGTAWFLRLALYQTIRGITYLFRRGDPAVGVPAQAKGARS
ncbi:UDP-forming cellulose synthase catalytic subunit [Rhizobium sp. EC-SD404]|uniref:UDP-forming cellulose synthase catalytic subunit n=1 Tax=Rhizobium sp. EC-SD404 TaxID=2038389 RepID=UPI00125219BE|nr:UDP-forming cellulose synthase catalytic subunit [Rhizobium sp. EC-SD404]VVT14764.1 Cellulose synthase (UDP-forming) [Rhizobium sp. EC-SD404]